MRVAITGGICDGKSVVLGFLSALGFPTLDADAVVKELYSDPTVVCAIEAAFGRFAVSDGSVNREWLRGEVVERPETRRKLNAIVHPPTIRKILDWSRAQAGHCFAEVPLLIETATQGLFDRVWVVMAGEEEQRRRLVERLGDPVLADKLLRTQLPTEAKAAFSDRILRTNTSLSSVSLLTTELVRELG